MWLRADFCTLRSSVSWNIIPLVFWVSLLLPLKAYTVPNSELGEHKTQILQKQLGLLVPGGRI